MELLTILLSVIGVGVALSVQVRSGNRRLETRIDTEMDRLDNRMDRLDNRMDRLDNRMDSIDLRMKGIETEVNSLGKEVAHLSGLVEGLREAIAHNRAA
ncbi:MAG: hypothetical protein OXH52_06455 [Gammaproteobacteria bacterium]|nr:hypothetical protein [Gammaproteobacteria bacterium]